jgi:hypothetical protein
MSRFLGSTSGFVDPMSVFVDSVREFRAQAHILCFHIYTATNANM